MAGYGGGYYDYDEYGRRVYVEGRRSSGRRYAPAPPPLPPGGWEEEDTYEEIRRVRREPRRQQAPPPQQQQPVINIFNDNQIDDRDNYEPPPPPRRRPQERVYYDTQVIAVDNGRDRESIEKSYQTRRDLEELERKRRDAEADRVREDLKKQIKAEEDKKKAEEAEAKEKEKILKEKAVEEWKLKQEKEKWEKEEKEKEKKAIGEEYMRQQLEKDGYTEEEIKLMMSADAKKRRGHSPSVTSSTSIVIANRPTFLKVHKKYIDPQTLDAYGLEWDWADDDYIVIHRWIEESEREILFEHTRKLKERKLIQFAEVETVEVRGVRKDRNGRLLMVRKKEDRSRSKSPGVVKTKKFFLG